MKAFYDGEPIPEDIMECLVEKYIKIFSKDPWNEIWTPEEVKSKIKNDFGKNSFLAVSLKDNEVLGFAWGKVLEVREITTRVKPNLGNKIDFSLPHDMKVIYFDEAGVDGERRRGLFSFRHLINVGFDYGEKKGAERVIFWTTPKSKIVPIVKRYGYEEVGKVIIEKEIIFLSGKIIRTKSEAK